MNQQHVCGGAGFCVLNDGLCTRDRLVLASCHARGVPVATVMSGGYASDINDTVEIHCNTIREAKKLSGIAPFAWTNSY